MKSLPILAAAAAALVALAAPAGAETVTGSGRPATQSREAKGFNGVELAIPGKMEIVQGDKEGVTLTADDNLLTEIETVVERDALRIRFRRGVNARTHAPIRVTLHAKSLESIALAGSGGVTLWAKQSLDVSVAGSGDVRYYGDPAVAKKIAGSGSARRAGATPG